MSLHPPSSDSNNEVSLQQKLRNSIPFESKPGHTMYGRIETRRRTARRRGAAGTRERYADGSFRPGDNRSFYFHLSNEKRGHTTGGPGRSGARQDGRAGDDGQNRTPTGRFVQETTVPLIPQTIKKNYPELVSGSTNKGNQCNLSIPKPRHTTGGSEGGGAGRQGGARRGEAGTGRTGRRRASSPRTRVEGVSRSSDRSSSRTIGRKMRRCPRKVSGGA